LTNSQLMLRNFEFIDFDFLNYTLLKTPLGHCHVPVDRIPRSIHSQL